MNVDAWLKAVQTSLVKSSLADVIIAHSELATIKRNELCPCNHYPTAWQVKKSKKDKKFKHCCGK
jgi:hypothetical protein